MTGAIKNIVISLIIVGALFFGYKYFFVKDPVSPLSVQENLAVAADIKEGKDYLVALINLERINFSVGSAVFNNPMFVRLRDMSVSLPDEPRGRSDPFMPIGEDVSGLTPAITTGQVKK